MKGAIGVVELKVRPDLGALKAAFVRRGVWIRPFGRTVYLTPALVIDPAELSALTGAVCEALAETGPEIQR